MKLVIKIEECGSLLASFFYFFIRCGFSTEHSLRMVYHTMQYYCGHRPFNQLIPFHQFLNEVHIILLGMWQKLFQHYFSFLKLWGQVSLNTRRLRIWNQVFRSEFFAPENHFTELFGQNLMFLSPFIFVQFYFTYKPTKIS